MKTFTIEVNGKSQADIENALEEVLRLIRGGFEVGFDHNSDGSFSFANKGEFEENESEN